jgi:hypothetical protein
MYSLRFFAKKAAQFLLSAITIAFVFSCVSTTAFGKEQPSFEEDLLLTYEEQYGEMGFGWSEETWLSFGKELRSNHIEHEIGNSYLSIIASQLYTAPRGIEISKEDAITAAEPAAAASGYIDFKQPYDTYALSIKRWDEDSAPTTWVVSFIQGDVVVSGEVDAKTGQAFTFALVPHDLLKTAPFVISDSYEIKHPRIWRTDEAPSYYWDTLDELIFTCANVEQMIDSWIDTFGENQMTWPLEYQAISWLWQESDSSYAPRAQIIGIPMPEDISQEKAISIATEALLTDAMGILSADTLASLKPYATFYYNLNGPGVHTWNISFAQPSDDNAYSVTLACYSINAQQGYIISFFLTSADVHG